MKKSILLLPIFFLMLFSCSDAYDIRQDSEVEDPEAFTTIQHLVTGLNGAYAAYGPDFGGDAIIFNDLFTDNLRKGDSNNGQGSEEFNFLMQPNSDMPEAVWGNRYATINRVNRVLRAYDRLYADFTTAEKRRADHVKGNLLALRALCHFDLFQYFTVDYKNAASPSVIKMDFVPASTFDVFPRNTAGEIRDFIKQDLTDAKTLLNGALDLRPGETAVPANIATYNTVMYLRPLAVDFIRCKLALLEGDYPTAQTLATALMAATPLSNASVYPTMYSDAAEANGECVFKLSRVLRNNQVASLYYFNYDGGTPVDPMFYGSVQLYGLYSATDVRRAVCFGGTNAVGQGVIPITKYMGSNDGDGISDIKLFRSSEAKLILAECKARNSDFLGAATDVRQLRTARMGTNPLPVYANLNAALTDILLERRKEFAFEGHRYLDIKRIGNEINVGVSRLAYDALSFSAPLALPASDYRFTLPIPRSEVSANPTITQNPNY